ncbi:MAG: gamma-glutamyl-gamma-aminobutyrate hydrolase family protein [Colwellia sp.]
MNFSKLPVIGVICDQEIVGPHPFHIAGDKYIKALTATSPCLPILIPALADESTMDQLLGMLDGLLCTGGYSMVDPLHYQNEQAPAETKLDKARDNTSIPLIKKAIAQGVPLLGVCRGFQELNVALGGSLHQKLHETNKYIEHREDKDKTLAEQYADSHEVELVAGSPLADLINQSTVMVNSLHTQGIDKLADGLMVNGVAPDGLVEAVSVKDAQAFAIAVQWHPEWQVEKNNQNLKLFKAFLRACDEKSSKNASV